MKSQLALLGTVVVLGLVVGLGVARQSTETTSQPVEIAILDEVNWDAFAPGGKEVDAIYGDVVLRNGYLTAVIAQPLATRHANMTVKDVAGAVIDLTVRESSNDQLAAFYPGRKVFPYRTLSTAAIAGSSTGITLTAEGAEGRPEAIVRYSLEPADHFLTVTSTFTNKTAQAQTVSLEDELRADGPKEEMVRTPNGTVDRFWLVDRFWGQAYGLDAAGYALQLTSDQRTSTIKYQAADGAMNVTLEPGQSFQFKRRLYPGNNHVDVNAIASNIQPSNASLVRFTVHEKGNKPLPGALIEFKQRASSYGTARTDVAGSVSAVLPKDVLTVDLFAFGRQIGTGLSIPSNTSQGILVVDFEPGSVAGTITDAQRRPIPCKVQFTPLDDSKLDFGPETGEFAVRNLVYSADGRFGQTIPAGQYSVMISHGPEYDVVTKEITVTPGQAVPLNAMLLRSVETPGWVSGDFHDHSSPSGDNTSSQLGRVLNLIAEHIEFAPCTEHNRVSTYQPHIDKLGIGSQLATVSGIELTSTPLPLCHQNAFPMKYTPRVQDGGGPISGPDLETQIERLALHDSRSEKLLQVNHPDIGWMFYDKDGDGKSDSGFERAFPFMDVIEVHPIERILDLGPFASYDGKLQNHTIFNWLQLLNQGFRIYGVVNTDSHHNYHGSGSLRNWIQSATDDPAKIDPMDIVRAAEKGRMVMSNGPYLEVRAHETSKSEEYVAGQDIKALSGQISLTVKVQCPNWLDVNRVFVLVNGRVHPIHNYSRDKNPDAFRGGVVKFERTLNLELKEDAHLIVATGDSRRKLGKVLGPEMGNSEPAAMTNPIFVDVNGDGFQPNRDTLDHPLPTRHPLPK